MYVTMPVADLETCSKSLAADADHNSFVCLLGPLSQGTCMGDLGSPYYLRDTNVVIGFTEYGTVGIDPETNEKKCLTELPSVGVNVYAYLDWINQRIHKKC